MLHSSKRFSAEEVTKDLYQAHCLTGGTIWDDNQSKSLIFHHLIVWWFQLQYVWNGKHGSNSWKSRKSFVSCSRKYEEKKDHLLIAPADIFFWHLNFVFPDTLFKFTFASTVWRVLGVLKCGLSILFLLKVPVGTWSPSWHRWQCWRRSWWRLADCSCWLTPGRNKSCTSCTSE